MPNLRLSDEQAAHITAYLITLGAKTDRPGFAQKLADNKVVEAGNRLIGRYGCYGCHDIYGMEAQPRVGAELTPPTPTSVRGKWSSAMSRWSRRGITSLRRSNAWYTLYNDGKLIEESWEGWTYGKLKNARMYATERIIQQMPDFAFSATPMPRRCLVQLRSFTDERLPASYLSTPSDEQALRVAGMGLFEKYNCWGCHHLAGQGGTIAPNLAYEGSKVRSDWLLSFLKQPHQIRPLMQARMPTFPSRNKRPSICVITS